MQNNELNKRLDRNDEKFEILSNEFKEQNIQFQQNINIKFDSLSRVLEKHIDERCESMK